MALEAGAFGPRRWDEDFVRGLMDEADVMTMVADDGGVLAYVMFAISRPYETVEVLSLAVSPGFRRRGIAKSLMSEAESMAEKEGAGTVSLCVRPDNVEGVNLYVSLGYKVLALCSGYYEDGSDAYMMVKHLE